MRGGELLGRTAMVILNYKSPSLTVSAAKHLLGFGTGIHVIIVDNCSGDDSRAVFTAAFVEEPLVHLVYNEDNRGYAHGNNVGIDYAESLGNIDFVGIMNPDVVVDADVIARLVEALDTHGDIGLITAECCYNGVYRVPNDCAWHHPTLGQLLRFSTLPGYAMNKLCKLLGRKYNDQNGYYPTYYEGKTLAPVDVVQGCFFIARLSTLLAIHKLDEATFLYYEENILAAKISARGMHNAVLVGETMQHNHHEKDKSLQRQGAKIFDMTCLHNSRRHYIENYLSCRPWVKKLLLKALDVDLEIRKLGVRVLIRK